MSLYIKGCSQVKIDSDFRWTELDISLSTTHLLRNTYFYCMEMTVLVYFYCSPNSQQEKKTKVCIIQSVQPSFNQ